MEALITAALIIGGLFAIGMVIMAASEFVDKKTGKGLSDWIWTLINTGLLLLVAYGGIALVRWGMNDNIVPLVIIGFAVIAVVAFFLYSIWTGDGRQGYDPMGGKRAHYNRDGKLTGYSDKD
jgi:uncharacterized membrane protein